MTDDFEDELSEGQESAIELVRHVKRMRATEMEIPLIDDTGVWLVVVRRLGILDD